MKRLLLFFVCTLLFANVIAADGFWVGDLKYVGTGAGEVAVSDCNGSVTSVNIPSSVTYQGVTYIVTGIGPIAFKYLYNLTSVTIPNSVTYIGSNVFEDCHSLTSVTIPNSVTSIGQCAFGACYNLTSVTIPNSVTYIGSGAFLLCYSLTSITIPNSITSIEDRVFEDCCSLTSVTIPNSVTSIGNSAFFRCSNLTSVNIPNSITSIGSYAFYDCSSLTSAVTIPNSVTSIGIQAFYHCSSLTSVTCLATNPPALGEYAFDYIGSPSTLYIPNGCGEAYENSSWTQYFDCIVELGSGVTSVNLNVEVNNEEWGSVEVYEGFCGTDTLRAVEEMDCSEFLRWSDGDTNNPRVVNVASDTSFTAIFKDPVLDTTINATIMQGETYNFNGQELSEEGVYNATVLSVLGCEINLTVNLYVISNDYTNGETSSLQETELEEIVFYPNPTKGLISFSKSIEKIEVVDISGKILLSFSNVREINIGDLPAGSYLLRLHSNENSVLRKIVKE